MDFVLFVIINLCFVSNQIEANGLNDPIVLSVSSKDDVQSISKGACVFQMNNYSLSEILVELFQISVSISESDNKNFNIRIKDKCNYTDEFILMNLIEKLSNDFNVNLSFTKYEQIYYEAYIADNLKMKVCDEDLKIEESYTIINKTWFGKCCYVSTFFEQLEETFEVTIVDHTQLTDRYDLNFIDSSFNEVLEEIYYDYGISFREKSKPVIQIITK